MSPPTTATNVIGIGDGPCTNSLPSLPKEAVFVKSSEMPPESVEVMGYDFNEEVDYSALLKSFSRFGLQATNLGTAIEEVQKMINARKEPLPAVEDDDERSRSFTALYDRPMTSCTIFLGYTSNLISAGTREIFRFLAQHNLVDCLVSSAGGIEEDFIKCLAPTYLGDFQLKGAVLRKQGINRIGNMLVPNNNYCHFEDWIVPILDKMLDEQNRTNARWTPSRVIHRLGKEIDDERSVYYWAYKNNIPVFCPGLTDGSLGDMLYFHSYKNPGLVIDIVEDIKLLNDMAVHSRKTGMIILGGGAMKHHIANANLMRNGADYCLYVNTGQEFDGSDSGARPDEAVSWGKIKLEARPVKVYCDASIAFPLIVAETFAKEFHATRK